MSESNPQVKSVTSSCNVCGQKVPRSAGGELHPHRTASGEPCFRGRLWSSVLPAASVIGWGLGLFLGAIIPSSIGIGQVLTASMYDESPGTIWFLLAAIMQVSGVVALTMGTYRLVRKADVGFLMAQDRYLETRPRTDSAALPE